MRKPGHREKPRRIRRADPRLSQPFAIGTVGILAGSSEVSSRLLCFPASIVSARLCRSDGGEAQVDPERDARFLGEFLSAMTDVAVAHRATIDAPTPRSIRLMYGHPHPRADDACRALRAALDMQQAFLALHNQRARYRAMDKTALGLAIGVASGQATAVPLAPDAAASWIATGAIMTAAARIGALAVGNEILIDASTRKRAEDQFSRPPSDLVFTPTKLSATVRLRPIFRCQYRRGRLHAVRHAPVGPDAGPKSAETE